MSTTTATPRAPGGHRRLVLSGLLLALGAVPLALHSNTASAASTSGTVLILGSTVTGGVNSLEAKAATSRGYTVEIVTDAQWQAKSAADFAGYRALVLGDPTCAGAPTGAQANRAAWGPAIDGNVVVNGTDPVFHASRGGAALTDKSMSFALDAPGKTGAYLSLSCFSGPTGAPIPVFDTLSTKPTKFTTRSVGCFNDAHIVATHPALSGLTDADLSNWSCSVHSAFQSWPEDFTPLAIARGSGATFTAADGSSGTPYILARGEGLSASSISLTPGASTVALPGTQALSALISVGGAPQAGKPVTFSVLSGPNAGATGTGTTDGTGTAGFTLTGTTAGTDTVVARFTDARGVEQTSNEAKVEWTGAVNSAPAAVADAYSTDEDTALVVPAPGVLGNDTDADGDALVAALATGPAHGTLTLDGNGSFTYTPAAEYSGPDSFTYTVSDGTATSGPQTVSLTVRPVDDAPVAQDDSHTTAEDTVLSVPAPGVTGNDTDVDSSGLTATLVSGPSHGTLSLASDGSFSYTPAQDYTGEDSFTYSAGDGTSSSAPATVRLLVTPVNDGPVAADDSYSTDEDVALLVPAPGVSGNDSDVDGPARTVTAATLPAHGTLALAGDGSFVYTPARNYHGPDAFTYTTSDGALTSAPATVTLTVLPVNDAPSCATVTGDATAFWPPNNKLRTLTLSGGSDVDGDALTLAVTRVTQDEPLTRAGVPDAVATATPSQVDLRASRSGRGDGRVYVVHYQLSDGQGGLCTGTQTVGVQHDQGGSPVPVDSGQTVNSFG